MKYFLYALKNIFNYSGRARRAEFGWFHLTNMIVQMGVMFIAYLFMFGVVFAGLGVGVNEDTMLAAGGVGFMVLMLIMSIFQFAMFLVTLSVGARRLHDLGWSGWWQLVIYVLPFILFVPMLVMISNSVDAQGHTAPGVAFLFVGLAGLTGIIQLVVFAIMLFKEGQVGSNKYGEDPKAEEREMYARLRAERAAKVAANQAATAPAVTQTQPTEQNTLNEKSSG